MALAQCPEATRNPDTGRAVGKKRIYDVMETRCYDEDPEKPWRNRPRLSKTMLTEQDEQKRLQWAHYMQSLRHTDK
eukprot:7403257-Karenia_brevis.AAC.1